MEEDVLSLTRELVTFVVSLRRRDKQTYRAIMQSVAPSSLFMFVRLQEGDKWSMQMMADRSTGERRHLVDHSGVNHRNDVIQRGIVSRCSLLVLTSFEKKEQVVSCRMVT